HDVRGDGRLAGDVRGDDGEVGRAAVEVDADDGRREGHVRPDADGPRGRPALLVEGVEDAAGDGQEGARRGVVAGRWPAGRADRGDEEDGGRGGRGRRSGGGHVRLVPSQLAE